MTVSSFAPCFNWLPRAKVIQVSINSEGLRIAKSRPLLRKVSSVLALTRAKTDRRITFETVGGNKDEALDSRLSSSLNQVLITLPVDLSDQLIVATVRCCRRGY